MVRSFTPSDSDEETKPRKKHRRKRSFSRSPHRSPPKKKKNHHTHSRSKSLSPPRRKIKSDQETSSPRRHHHDDRNRHREKRKHRHRVKEEEEVTYDPHRPIKREPEDDTREQRRERRRNDERRRENRRNRGGNPFHQDDANLEYGQSSQGNEQDMTKDKDKPDFKLSGKLTEDTNTYRGVVIKYNQPPEARKPKKRWRLYPFKGDESLPILHIHRNSAYLIGRDRIVVDIPTDHPSCSKQHAVLQYRMVDFERGDGTVGRRVSPYVIDLGSSNGTYVNNQRIEAQRYVELFEKDVLKFGYSTREYVLLHDKTDTKEMVDEGKDSDSD